MDQLNIRALAKKYRYVLLVLLAGIILMCLPAGENRTAPPESATEPAETEDMESRLEGILRRIKGAGEVAVMLTEASAEEIIYQTDGEGHDTVLITGADRSEAGLIRSRQPAVYQGAIVVCGGADSAAVRLAIVEAVGNVTGLGSDRITVLKME